MFPFGPIPSFSGNKTKIVKTAEELKEEWTILQTSTSTYMQEQTQEEKDQKEEED